MNRELPDFLVFEVGWNIDSVFQNLEKADMGTLLPDLLLLDVVIVRRECFIENSVHIC